MLLDQKESQLKDKNVKHIRLVYGMLQASGLVYGCWLFARYWILKEQYSNPLLPSYTTDFVFANEAYKGIFLLGGMALSQIGFLFHHLTGLILLVVTYLSFPFAFHLFV